MSEKYICKLTPEVQALAEKELNEDPNTRESDVERLRTWIKRTPYLKARTDTKTILRYLRGCKFSIPRAKEKIEKYYTFKAIMPELFDNRDPLLPSLREIFDLKLMVPLPGYDQEGRRVILGRLGAWDPGKHRPEVLFRAASMLFDVLFIEDEQLSVTGFVQVHDMSGLTFKHVASLSFGLVKKVMSVWTEGYPTRPKAVHYINTSFAFDAVYHLFSMFMKPKMRSRIKVHGSKIDNLYKYVPREMLPTEYGGSGGTLEELTNTWKDKLTKHRDWFLEDEQFKVDIVKRNLEKSQNSLRLYGLGGLANKKLEID